MKFTPGFNDRKRGPALLVAAWLLPALLCAEIPYIGEDGERGGNGQDGEIGLGGSGGYSFPIIHLNGFSGGNGGNGAAGGNGGNGGAGVATIRDSTPVTNEFADLYDIPIAPAGFYVWGRLGGQHGQDGSSTRGYNGGRGGNGGAYNALGEFGQRGEDPNSYAGRNEVWQDPLFTNRVEGTEGLNGGGGGGGPNNGWPVNGYKGGDGYYGYYGRANDGLDGVNGANGTVIGTFGSAGQSQNETLAGGQNQGELQIGGDGGDAGNGGRGGNAGGGGGGSGEYFFTIGIAGEGGIGGSGGLAGTPGYGAHGTLVVESGGVAAVGELMWGSNDYDPEIGFYNFYVILHYKTLLVGSGTGGAAGTLEVRSGGTLKIPDKSSLIVANLSSEAGSSGVASTLSLLAGSTTINDGTLTLQNPSQSLNNHGTFTGKGTVETSLINHGIFAPGNSTGTIMVAADHSFVPGTPIGTMTINGNYEERGILQIELGETANDMVDVSGNVTIGSGAQLETSLLFNPNINPDDTLNFDIIKYTETLSGTFDDNLAALPGYWTMATDYDLGGGTKSIRLTREPLPVISFQNQGTNTIIEANRLSSGGTTHLQRTTNLITGIWSNCYDTTGVSSTNWPIVFPDTPNGFYRLKID